ncbi:nitrilase-related carbon-nitrogen hydrolase [Glutamicibacter sp.]|uniref:nitrilase-related carbon-nitrogen hydrolase n=1 Tax=Glutamicibacter sp. TaxID=1931995 RepID=UPI002FE3BD62
MQSRTNPISGENRALPATLQVAVLQATSRFGDTVSNLSTLERWASKASSQGAQLMVTPELFVPGYDPSAVYSVDGASHRKTMAEIAAKHRIGLVASTVELDGDQRYICASLFDGDGNEVSRYRKSHLFGSAENEFFTASADGPKVVSFRGVKLAMGICFDAEFPEFIREAALKGAELMCIPTAVPKRDVIAGEPDPFDASLVPEVLVRARAVESQLYIAYANQAAPNFVGRSTVVSPLGQNTSASADADELIMTTVDLGVVGRARSEVDYLEVARKKRASS